MIICKSLTSRVAYLGASKYKTRNQQVKITKFKFQKGLFILHLSDKGRFT